MSIENGIKSLSIDDRGFARQTVKNDKHINQLNYNINERVIMLITKQQAIASDLRDDFFIKNRLRFRKNRR